MRRFARRLRGDRYESSTCGAGTSGAEMRRRSRSVERRHFVGRQDGGGPLAIDEGHRRLVGDLLACCE